MNTCKVAPGQYASWQYMLGLPFCAHVVHAPERSLALGAPLRAPERPSRMTGAMRDHQDWADQHDDTVARMTRCGACDGRE